MEFVEFPKIARLSREVVISEKIDGTNGLVYITEPDTPDTVTVYSAQSDTLTLATFGNGQRILAGSRTQWITPDNDNHGFAKWVLDHADELRTLGPGRHFGEWWGQGIQRKYGLNQKRWSLFNSIRWCGYDITPIEIGEGKFQTPAPACCHVVPVLYRGPFDTKEVDLCLQNLKHFGSVAAPQFMKPEGVVVFHTAANMAFKKTIERDAEYKGKQR